MSSLKLVFQNVHQLHACAPAARDAAATARVAASGSAPSSSASATRSCALSSWRRRSRAAVSSSFVKPARPRMRAALRPSARSGPVSRFQSAALLRGRRSKPPSRQMATNSSWAEPRAASALSSSFGSSASGANPDRCQASFVARLLVVQRVLDVAHERAQAARIAPFSEAVRGAHADRAQAHAEQCVAAGQQAIHRGVYLGGAPAELFAELLERLSVARASHVAQRGLGDHPLFGSGGCCPTLVALRVGKAQARSGPRTCSLLIETSARSALAWGEGR